jgi:pimeloyl-ACP methyl ester carboxylesterase
MNWELYETGPRDAEHTILLLPGGLCSARSYLEVMTQPALRDLRLIAATLPGHCGTTPPKDVTVPSYARLTGELIKDRGCDVVVGYSIGASVAFELVASGAFTGPVVLLGISLSAADEPWFFHTVVRLGSVFGSIPSAALIGMTGMMLKSLKVSPDRKAELAGDFHRNQPHVIRPILAQYRRYLREQNNPAMRLCDAAVPTWVAHAEKGDGGLTADEHRMLEGCAQVTVISLPGTGYLLPVEKPEKVADILAIATSAI